MLTRLPIQHPGGRHSADSRQKFGFNGVKSPLAATSSGIAALPHAVLKPFVISADNATMKNA
jgi:hypothetical protein